LITEKSAKQLAQIIALLDAGDKQNLRLLLNDEHPADIAEWLSHMDEVHRLGCFRLLDLDNASNVLAELDPEVQQHFLRELGDIGVVSIISRMSPDDAADLLGDLPEGQARLLIDQITDKEVVEDIQELMAFDEKSAGGIMSTDYLALLAKMPAGEALKLWREKYAKLEEDIYDAYVVDGDNHLVGYVSVKALLNADADASVELLMDCDVVRVAVDDDQEVAAEKLQHYDLLSLPVIDGQGKLRGIITADDIIDVIEEEATEDIYQASGISLPEAESSETLAYDVPLAVRARLPWLFVTLVIEAGSAFVISHFNTIVQQAVVAVSFMPLLSAVTGSAATQSTCIIIRGMATGRIEWVHAWKNVWHEIKVGVLLGFACAAVTTATCLIFHYGTFNLGMIVGFSLFVTLTVGVTTGTLTPMIFHRLGIEPENASGPLITSLLDVYTFTIYLTIIRIFLTSVV
jgi:magnesium transporter